MRRFAPLFLLLALPIHGQGLDDLRSALRGMRDPAPLRGTFAVAAWSREGQGQEMKESSGAASAWVEEEAGGLRIRWDQALLGRAESEGPKGGSTLLGLEGITPLKVRSALNFAPALEGLLAKGHLKQEVPSPYQGHPARLLEVQLPPPEAGNSEAKAKENTYTARIWVGTDGVPLAASFTHVMKASKLFISMEMTAIEELTFAPAARRLVVLRREERRTVRAMGTEAQQRTLTTFQEP